MTKLMSVLAMALAAWGLVLLGVWLMVSPAKAHHPYVVPVTRAAPPAAHHSHHHHGHKFLCFTPGGFVVCAVGTMIVADEIRRSMAGPACATNKMTRQSYFGVVRDEPKLWRPACNFRQARSVRAAKLWPNGK